MVYAIYWILTALLLVVTLLASSVFGWIGMSIWLFLILPFVSIVTVVATFTPSKSAKTCPSEQWMNEEYKTRMTVMDGNLSGYRDQLMTREEEALTDI